MILSKIRVIAQERLDLEDLNGLMAASRTDSKYSVQKMLSNLNYVVNGFTVSGIGLKAATVNMADGTLIIPENTKDFSWYTTSPTDPNVQIPDADLVDGTRNYVEMILATENNTPVARAFWDPEANGGEGLEFNQIVDTITDLTIKFVVHTGGFTGSPDALPLCIIDTDSAGTIKQIFDERKLFHRLGTPTNPNDTFQWGSKEEPAYSAGISSTSGTFQVNEQITIGTEIATVLIGGTTSIAFQLPSSKNFFPGDLITGLTSGATATLESVYESFTGVDKSVKNLKEDLDAIKTEILAIKTNGSGFWWQSGESITELRSSINQIAQVLSSGSYDEDMLIASTVALGTNLDLPVNSREAGSPQQFYTVGLGALEVYLNGQRISQNVADGWSEVGLTGAPSKTIKINQELTSTDLLAFRLGIGGAGSVGGSGGGGGSAPDDDFVTLPESTTADNLDFVLIRDVSLNAYRKQRRSTFLSGLGSNLQVETFTTNHTVDVNLDQVLLMDAGMSNKTFSLPDPTTCGGVVFRFKKIDSGLFSMIINGAGFMIDGQTSISTNTQFESVTVIADSAGAQWVSI